MISHLALMDEALFIFEVEFDGILDGDDMLFKIGIDIVDHRGECGGFSRSSRSSYEDESLVTMEEIDDAIRDIELLTGRDSGRNISDSNTESVYICKDIDTKLMLIQRIRKISFKFYGEFLGFFLPNHFLDDGTHVI